MYVYIYMCMLYSYLISPLAGSQSPTWTRFGPHMCKTYDTLTQTDAISTEPTECSPALGKLPITRETPLGGTTVTREQTSRAHTCLHGGSNSAGCLLWAMPRYAWVQWAGPNEPSPLGPAQRAWLFGWGPKGLGQTDTEMCNEGKHHNEGTRGSVRVLSLLD